MVVLLTESMKGGEDSSCHLFLWLNPLSSLQ
jgi:hypothetical protein